MAVATFRERAHAEASRYAGSRWVFIRELLQNARDAGAESVQILVERSGAVERIRCRDNGEGMTFDHARRYLFTLYASSKSHHDSAGRFGIGFWSVLRFEPQRICVRSRSSGEDGWQVELDGSLERVRHSRADLERGTEVVLERPASEPNLESLVAEAARLDARFLRQRDRADTQVAITVNGRAMNREFSLPDPSRSFAAAGLRGVVGLGPEPLVEVFAHGLRVRSAPLLADLLSDEPQGASPPPGGLMPRMILDGDDLEVLLARNDLREDAALRRLVRRAQRELERLVVGELDRAAPLTLAERLVEAAAAAWRRSRLVRLTAAVASGIALGLALGAVLDPLLAPRRSDNPTATTNRSTAGSMPPTVAPAPVPYRDLAATYSGPEVELPRRAPRPLDLRYSPPDRSLLLTAVRIWGIDESGAALHPAAGAALRPYPGAPCSGPCTEISLAIEADPGTIRLPVPTDQVVVEESATLDGVPVSLWLTGNAEVAIVTESAVSGRIRFQTTAAAAPIQAPAPTWPSLPPPLSLEARALGQLPLQMRVDEAVALVTSRVSYDRSPRAGERHRRAAEAGASFVTRTLEIGSGDCDVLNALLASVLQAAGVECCLAVGWVGLNGTTLPGLHAWVEYRDRTGGWRVADASSVAQTSPSDAGPGDPAASVLTSTATQEPAPRADTTPAPALGSTMEGDPRRALIIAAAVAFSALVAAAAIALLVASRRTRSTTGRAEDAGRLEDIIRGALRRPQAFAHIRTLFERPVVPLRSGRRISLRRCLRLSRTGRLYGAATDSTLSLRATSVGAAVLDTARREGRAVASLLAADDLDEWASMLDQRLGTPATDLLNRALRRAGEQIRAYEFLGAGDGPRVLDLRGIDPKLPTRVVLVPSDCALAHDVALSHETVGAFVLGDATVHALGLSQARQARVLFPLAARLIANRTAE